MSQPAALPQLRFRAADPQMVARLATAISAVGTWMKQRDYAGYDPFDLLNSPFFSGAWARRFPFSLAIRMIGSRYGGIRLRRLLRVREGINAKALGLVLAGYCDSAGSDPSAAQEVRYIKACLRALRSPDERAYCWGYNFDSVALRSTTLLADKPNIITTLFCANALLDMADTFGDKEADFMGCSAGEFIARRLNRYTTPEGNICFSYSPADHTQVYNTSALTAAFLARVAKRSGNAEYLDLAKRAIGYIVAEQQPDGSWFYGSRRRQRWIDSFHTAYVLSALHEYRELTGDKSVSKALTSGYQFFKQHFLQADGAVAYYHNNLYPIDIHALAQAIITLCDMSDEDAQALPLAANVARWTLDNMQYSAGEFAYQRHRRWTNRTPYMRWGQAWMFRAMTRLHRELSSHVA
jgi:hypothetical protein